jgi:cobalt-zinc-cadmium efflux system membrane fusion protein
MRLDNKSILAGTAAVLAALALLAGIYLTKNPSANAAQGNRSARASGGVPENPVSGKSVTLNDDQLKSIKIEPVGRRLFVTEREAVGNIAFDDDRSVQVYPPNQGKIIELFADLGDNVVKGQKLYTINSPDLIQAESALIQSAGVLELTTKALERARKLYETQGIAQKDLQQTTSDQQAAEGAFKAARDTVGIFGKTRAEIDHIVASRQTDPVMVVHSPITGRITARNAAPGLLAQPGTPPAPFSVADISTMWMVAYVAESDSPFFHVGQEVDVRLMAFPGRVFKGKISASGTALDPATHRLMVRSEIRDPKHELRPGMLATFTIRTGKPVSSVAVPVECVVREGDGTMTVWVTTDRHTFVPRAVELGMQKDNFYSVVKGLKPGELVVAEGGVFLSNMLEAHTDD